MAYGSAAMRAYYGAGDAQLMTVRGQLRAFGGRSRARAAVIPMRRVGYTRGAYMPAGGFGSFLKKATKFVGKATKMATAVGAGFATGGVMGALKGGLGVLASGGGMGIAGQGSLMQKAAQFAIQGGAGAKPVGLSAFRALEAPRKKRSTRRKRTSSRRRKRTSSRRRRRSSYARGDYGDDWSGNRPSRAKHSGQFLTRAGGRRRRRRRGGSRRGRVTFRTKDGRVVSFTPRR